jgi:hypothetical protein
MRPSASCDSRLRPPGNFLMIVPHRVQADPNISTE